MKRLLVILAALVMGTFFLQAPAHAGTWDTPPPTGSFKVIEYNIGSGSECFDGTTFYCLTFLEQEIANLSGIDLVLGTEFCYSDYLQFQTLHPTWEVYWSWSEAHKWPNSADHADGKPYVSGCQEDPADPDVFEAKGNIIAGPNLGSQSEYTLTADNLPASKYDSNSSHFGLLCAVIPTNAFFPTRACVAHLEAGTDDFTDSDHNKWKYLESDRKHQLRTITNIKDGVATGNLDSTGVYGSPMARPLIGGDFNANTSDNYWNTYLSDTATYWTASTYTSVLNGVWSSTWPSPNYSGTSGDAPGTWNMIDPGPGTAVDHTTFRNYSSPAYGRRTLTDTRSGTTTHNMQQSWVKY